MGNNPSSGSGFSRRIGGSTRSAGRSFRRRGQVANVAVAATHSGLVDLEGDVDELACEAGEDTGPLSIYNDEPRDEDLAQLRK